MALWVSSSFGLDGLHSTALLLIASKVCHHGYHDEWTLNCVSFLLAGTPLNTLTKDPFYSIPATIAVNMIMAAAGAGLVATIIAGWAQVWLATHTHMHTHTHTHTHTPRTHPTHTHTHHAHTTHTHTHTPRTHHTHTHTHIHTPHSLCSDLLKYLTSGTSGGRLS